MSARPRRWAWVITVLCAQRLIGQEPFAVLLADDLMVGAAADPGADGRAVQ